MACNGNNHPPWCRCAFSGGNGFGGGTRGGQPLRPLTVSTEFDGGVYIRQLRSAAPGFLEESREFRTVNTKCPVCGGKVYFYQNRFGSRVFFNALGKPWPKHPCTSMMRYGPKPFTEFTYGPWVDSGAAPLARGSDEARPARLAETPDPPRRPRPAVSVEDAERGIQQRLAEMRGIVDSGRADLASVTASHPRFIRLYAEVMRMIDAARRRSAGQ